MIRVTVSRNEFPRVAAGLAPRTAAAKKVAVAAIEQSARLRARRRTGRMASSWSARGDTVTSADPKAKYHEFGTRKMSAQPMLRPAVDAARPKFLAALRDVFRI